MKGLTSKSRAYGYLRVSTDEQHRSGLGLEDQRRAVEAAARRHGVQVARIHVDDEGVSGALPPARRGLVELLAELRPGDVLLCAKRDRLGRDYLEIGGLERELRALGVRFLSAAGEGTEVDDPRDPGGFLQRSMTDVIAHHERLLISARTRAALAAKRLRGEVAGTCPYGYRMAADGRKLVSDPHEQRVIRHVLVREASGWTERAIVAELARRRIKTRSGRPLGKTQVHRIISKVRGIRVPSRARLHRPR